MIEYVLIYAEMPYFLNETYGCLVENKDILLVLKDKLPFLAGKYNLVGGKIDFGETPEIAAIREFKEETGISVSAPILYGNILGDGVIVYCYKVILDPQSKELKPRAEETETVAWHGYGILHDQRLVPNLKVIIPFFMNNIKNWEITATDDLSSFEVRFLG